MLESTELLTCSSCKLEKPKSDFSKNRSRSRGYAYQCKTCKGALDKKLYSTDKNKSYKYVDRYGITVDDYNSMFEEQQGCCAICSTHQSALTRSLAVDHCHETGKVRGLLCISCNVGLGHFKDSLINLNMAISYLNKED